MGRDGGGGMGVCVGAYGVKVGVVARGAAFRKITKETRHKVKTNHAPSVE